MTLSKCNFTFSKCYYPPNSYNLFFISKLAFFFSQFAAERIYKPRRALNSFCNCTIGIELDIWIQSHFENQTRTKNQIQSDFSLCHLEKPPLSVNVVRFFSWPQNSTLSTGQHQIHWSSLLLQSPACNCHDESHEVWVMRAGRKYIHEQWTQMNAGDRWTKCNGVKALRNECVWRRMYIRGQTECLSDNKSSNNH